MSRPIFFQAAHLSDQESIDQFTVRQHELDRLLGEIRRDDMSSSIQHYVLIGQRGSGKSTLLRRVEAAVQTEAELTSRLVAVNLSEEQAGIYRLHDLWDRTAEEMREKGYSVDEVDWNHFNDDHIALSRASYSTIQRTLRDSKRKLVLLLDNIDRIFRNLDKDEAHLFRELLINHREVRIIGGSTLLSEQHWKYDKPFYEFFQMIRLEPLSALEMRSLLGSWADRLDLPVVRAFAESEDGRLDALRVLSDGMPRTMLHLVELITQRPDQNSYEYLLHIVDKATAIYQERLGTMSPHQQKVLLELSFFWEAASAGQLKATARMDAKQISAALNKLTEAGYVETIPGKGKNHLYRVKERFFNLWLIMTQGGPKQKRRVKYLTIFLEIWYGKDGLAQYVTGYRERLKQGVIAPGHAALMTQALARSGHISAADRDALIEDTRSILAGDKEFAEYLPPTSTEACSRANALLLQGMYAAALSALGELDQETATKNLLLAWAEGGLGRSEECHRHVGKALAIDGDAGILNGAGVVYHRLNNIVEAKDYYMRAIDLGNVEALYNQALLFGHTGEVDQAKAYYLLAIGKGDVPALNNLANLYRQSGRFEEAEATYQRAIELGNWMALFNLALLDYERHEPPTRAIDLLDRLGDGLDEIGVRKRCLRITLQTWSGRPEQVEPMHDVVRDLLAPNSDADGTFWLSHFLIHHRTQEIWSCFTSEELGATLKERFEPLYYATAKLIGKAGEGAFRVMPTELAATVEDIVKDIFVERLLYYPQAGKQAGS